MIIGLIIWKRRKIKALAEASTSFISQSTGTMPALGNNWIGTNEFLDESYPIGIRYNNPGNLRKTDITWQGELSDNPGSFERFISFKFGLRAMIKDLQSKISSGTNTIKKILYIYAPPDDGNDTIAYINTVSSGTGINADSILNRSDKNTMFKLVREMIKVEQGQKYVISEQRFTESWEIL